ncbi:putative polyketide synthase [Aspergillus indologenus CBS 114.80]|uniref:Putative polyketide synthase n=1 Tax=Aspergillus indologenus CBS 114.80 TaxID=1450541 RepID=A0A2V5IC01_9EURO|nr:putative polyketide synthase [Aspergillus indologenus CBS 114.80]
MAQTVEVEPPTPLAIVGLSFKLPQDAVTPESFWQMLVERRCATTEFPPDRLNIDTHHRADTDRLDTLSMRGAHFLAEDLSRFDAPFFSITAAEAEAMEPPQRLILEAAFRALENAGIPLQRIAKSRTAVFAGSSGHDWLMSRAKDPLHQHKYDITGTTGNMLANRVSWFFDLTGPSATVDTACSSSLMAIDMTCQSIWSGQATMGMAIGSNLLLAAEVTQMMDNLGLLSKDSRCFSFDDRANGYSRGEGVGVLIIKTVEDAVRDGDVIRAVIRSSASNQDGKTPGITQPSAEMQAALVRETYVKAGLDIGQTRYFEAHGTGTAVGDPIETRAIGSVFRLHRSPDEPLYIGSVKSNIGHLEGASGIAGMIKVILALEKGIIPPNSENLQALNPRIDEEFWNVKVTPRLVAPLNDGKTLSSLPKFPQEALPWPTGDVRRASISSFGYGGSNTHIVLDDAYHFLQLNQLEGNHNTMSPLASARSNGTTQSEVHHQVSNGINGVAKSVTDAPKLLVWSAGDEAGIPRLQEIWGSFFSSKSAEYRPSFLNNLAHTLASRRTHLPWRTFAVAWPSDDLEAVVERFSGAVQSRVSPNLAMIFSGQGAQWYGMGRELLHTFPAFRQSIEEAGEYLRSLGCEWDPINELQRSESKSNVNRTEYSQILCTILQVALVDLLRSFNIVPKAVLGHSSGEVAAAYCSRAISRRSAWKVSYFRGNMSSRLEKTAQMKGSMLAVALSEKEVLPYIEAVSAEFEVTRLTVGCINSPKSTTISGEGVQLDALKARLDLDKIFCRRLKVNLAYHSAQMKEIAAQYLEALGELEGDPSEPHTRPQMVSSITGEWIDPDEPRQASHWVRNMISPVRFSDGLATLCSASSNPTNALDGSHRRKRKIDHLLEIGPHSVLQGACKDILRDIGKSSSITYLSLLVRNMSAVDTAFSVFGDLYTAGYPIDLALVNQDDSTCRTLPDLPEYPFNHDRVYWNESRINKGHRLRQFARNDLLGLAEQNQNPLEARWRNIIRVSEMPWVQDHKINGTILYPGAGMVVMAIEAAKQLADPSRPISGFNVRDVAFRAAIRVPSGPHGIETNFHLRPSKNMESKRSGWFDFNVCTFENEVWTDNCTGSIQIVYGDKEEEMEKALAVELQAAQRDAYSAAAQTSRLTMGGEKLYHTLEESGYGYGPAFQLVKELCQGKAEAEVTALVQNFSTSLGETIHPTTLDAILQTAIWAAVPSEMDMIPTAVPTYVETLWVDSHALSSTMLKVHGTCSEVSQFVGPSSSIVVLDDNLQKTLVSVAGLRMNIVDTSALTGRVDESADSLCHQIEWKPDLKLLSNAEITGLCSTVSAGAIDHERFYKDLDVLLAARGKETLSALVKTGFQPTDPKLKKYHTWLIHHQQTVSDDVASQLTDPSYLEEAGNRILGSKQGYLYAIVARNLTKLLTGELDPSSLLEEDMLKAAFQEHVAESHGIRGLGKYLDLLAHRLPKMKILQLGGDAGSVTGIILATLGGDAMRNRRYAHLDFTDVSPESISTAKERFASEAEHMGFNVLDIERDPATQGIECGTYDVVVASMVFHKTACFRKALQNARRLLKPDGKLVVYEGVVPECRSTFVSGLFEQWWQDSEPHCNSCRYVDEGQWDEILRQTGYSGVDVSLPDFDSERSHECSLMISTAVENKHETRAVTEIEVVYDSKEPDQEHLAHAITKQCESIGCTHVRSVSLEETISHRGDAKSLQVFVIELQRPVWTDIQPELYEKLQSYLSSASQVLWVNQGGGVLPSKPHFRLVEGLFRVLMEEDGRRNLRLLCLEPEKPLSQVTQHVAKLAHFLASPAAKGADTEYVEQSDMLHIPRIVTPAQLNETVSRKASSQQRAMQKFGCQVPLQLDATSPGLISGFQFLEDTTAYRPLKSDEIEIQVKCAGVNFRDVLIAVGQLKATHTGSECSGIVSRVGEAVSKFRVGDAVAALGDGCFATSIRVHENGPVVQIPRGISFQEAAAVPVNYATAYVALHNVARIQVGESVLIHSGTGGTGQAAIQIAKNAGATIFATVGSQSKKRFLIDTYQIPETHIFSSRTTLFAQAIKHRTGGKGVDIILNSLAGESLLASWECMAPYGRFLEIGKRDILSNQRLPMSQFLRNVTYSGVDLAAMSVERPEVCAAALGNIFASVQQGSLHPSQPIHQHGVGEIEKAFRIMQGGQHVGKMVLDMRPEDEVLVSFFPAPTVTVLDTKPTYALNPDSTFVICGGLGGLGSNIAHWFADRGARHLLLLSRSGGQSERGRMLVEQLQRRGVQVLAPACDVSDEVPLQNTLQLCKSQMPPIRGCLNAAMVLRDALFENISHQAWHESLAPKVQGSWNLHRHLPRGLDFFIMLSSISGIVGTTGQANYAAGNAFQDALARHRVALGEKATALDLGVFDFAGAVAEDAQLRDMLIASMGLEPVTEPQLHALLDYYCDPQVRLDKSSDCQVTVGLSPNATQAMWLKKPMFGHLTGHERAGGSAGASDSIAGALQRAESLASAHAVAMAAIAEKLSKALSIAVTDMDASKPLHQYGVDSLVAVELRSWFAKELQAEMAVFDILGGATLTSVAQMATSKSKLYQDSWM